MRRARSDGCAVEPAEAARTPGGVTRQSAAAVRTRVHADYFGRRDPRNEDYLRLKRVTRRADFSGVNIVLIPALLGLVGFLVYYKKNQSKSGPGKPEKAGKARKTKAVRPKRPAKAAKALKAEKAETASPAPVKARAQRQTANAGGRMGSVL